MRLLLGGKRRLWRRRVDPCQAGLWDSLAFPRSFQSGAYGDSSVSGLDRKRTHRETT